MHRIQKHLIFVSWAKKGAFKKDKKKNSPGEAQKVQKSEALVKKVKFAANGKHQ
jgi:hypothetical protein